MSWCKHDLALCVKDDWDDDGDPPQVRGGTPDIKRGTVHEVVHIIYPPRDFPRVAHLLPHPEYLSFDAACEYGYRSDWFVKVSPREADEFDRETIALMRDRELMV